MTLEPRALVAELIALPGPPGQEDAVREAVARHAEELGCAQRIDARGNLLMALPGTANVPEQAEIVVMAHLDEIALLVERVEDDGRLKVVPMGGLLPWKCGEGPMLILARDEHLPGILSFGSIHSNAPENPATRAREIALTWDMARVFTGLSKEELTTRGVRPGTRVVLGPQRRQITEVGDFIAAPFLDDRADLTAMLLAMQQFADAKEPLPNVVFAATVAEEVGGHGALYLLRALQPAIGIALEVGPRVPESPFVLDANPTVWVNDTYSAMRPEDIELVAAAGQRLGLSPHFQALSRGGSDASCAASLGLVARPITLAFAAENSHGCEITHKNSVANLARLLVEMLRRIGLA